MGAIYIPKSKKKAQNEKAIIVYQDEASFRLTPTLHQTWAPLNSQPQVPTKGQRNTQKVLGAVSLFENKFEYRHQTDYFNAITYISFLEDIILPAFYKRNRRVYLIQDNASYHKKQEVFDWYKSNRGKVEVFLLPSYSPEFNAIERIWQYTRKHATHNRYFDSAEDLCQALFRTFSDIQKYPQNISGLLRPFAYADS